MARTHRSRNTWGARAMRGAVAIGALAAVVIASACSSSTANQKTGGGNAGDQTRAAKAGGSILVYVGQQFLSFDPVATQINQFGAQGGFLQALYDVLFYVDAKSGKVMPGLGKSLTPNADCSTWTMTLKPNIKFTDGTPLNAQAVADLYQRILDPQSHSPMIAHLAGDSVKVTGDLTLDVTMAKPNCLFDADVANNLTFVPSPTAVKKEGKQFYAEPVGAGPFTLKNWDRSANKAVMVKNPSYYTSGEPYLDQVTFQYATNGTTAVQSLIANQAQLAAPLTDPKAVDKIADAGLGETVIPMNGGAALQFNTLKKPFTQLCARQAVAYGLNPQAMDTALNPTKNTRGATSTVFQPDSPFYDKSITFATNDKAKAQQAASQCASAGNPVTFTVLGYAGFDDDTVQYIGSRLNAIPGFKVKVKVIPISQAATTVFLNRDFQLTTYPGGMFFGTPSPALDNWLGTKAATNLTGYSSADMDAALLAARSTTDVAKQKQAYDTVQKLWVHDLPFLLWDRSYYYFGYQKSLTGILPVNPGNELLLIQKVGFAK